MGIRVNELVIAYSPVFYSEKVWPLWVGWAIDREGMELSHTSQCV